MKKLLIVLCVLALTGCGSATKHYLMNDPDAIPVNFTVHLDKDFVKNMSTLGGGQAAMLILVGPFTNNAILMEAKELIETVANFYGIHVSEMIGLSRKRELVVPRQVAMYLMREEVGASFPLIGKELGNRDHTTAMHAYEKIKDGIEQNSRTKQEIDLIKQRLYNQ